MLARLFARTVFCSALCSLGLVLACNGQTVGPGEGAASAGNGGTGGTGAGRKGTDPAPPGVPNGPGGRGGSAGVAGSTGSYTPPGLGVATPAPFTPSAPAAPVATICGQPEPTSDEVANSIERFVGRFQSCDGGLGDTGHLGFEISGTLRWRFLDADASGALVPAPDNSSTRGWLQTDQHHGDLVLYTDRDAQDYALIRLQGAAPDAFAITIQGPGATTANRQEHMARATPSPTNGERNHGDLQGGFDCSLVGTWENPVSELEEPTASGVRTITFDDQGRFYAYRKKGAVFGVDAVDETGTWFISQQTLHLVTIAGDIGPCARVPRALGLQLSFGAGSGSGPCGGSKQQVVTDDCTGAGLFQGLVYIIRRE